MIQNSPLKVTPRRHLEKLDEKHYKKANFLTLEPLTTPAWANMFSNDEEDVESSSPMAHKDRLQSSESESSPKKVSTTDKIDAPTDLALPIEANGNGGSEQIMQTPQRFNFKEGLESPTNKRNRKSTDSIGYDMEE